MQEPHFLKGSLKMNEKKIQEARSILHDTQALVSNSCWRATSLEELSFLEDMEKIQREMCNIKGNFMSFIFYIKNVIEIIEWLHESFLKNNEFIDKHTIQNEQLLEKLQDTCFSSYVSNCQMVDCLEDSHDMVDLEDTCRYLGHRFGRFLNRERVGSFTYRLTLLRSLCFIVLVPSLE